MRNPKGFDKEGDPRIKSAELLGLAYLTPDNKITVEVIQRPGLGKPWFMFQASLAIKVEGKKPPEYNFYHSVNVVQSVGESVVNRLLLFDGDSQWLAVTPSRDWNGKVSGYFTGKSSGRRYHLTQADRCQLMTLTQNFLKEADLI